MSKHLKEVGVEAEVEAAADHGKKKKVLPCDVTSLTGTNPSSVCVCILSVCAHIYILHIYI